MKEQITNVLKAIKEFWKKLSKKMKVLIISAICLVLLVAIGITVFLNLSAKAYKVLFDGTLNQQEAMQVYAAVEELGVTPQIDQSGQVAVPANQWDTVLFDLYLKGAYPTKALAYDTYSENSGFTTTESERSTYLLFTTQERIQGTLENLEAIRTAVVTISIPEKSNYVWEKDKNGVSSAAVTLTLEKGKKFSPEQVSAVKALVSHSVPNMLAENVTVVDAATGLELEDAADDEDITSGISFKRLEYEREIEKSLEEKVRNILAGGYPQNDIQVAATVELNYDKEKSESKELIPGDNGQGMITHNEERFTLNGIEAAGGIVGEENNTDIPQYGATPGNEEGGMTDYEISSDFDIGYLLKQTEKGVALLRKATISVVVNDDTFTQTKQDNITQLISNATNIVPENITVTNLSFAVTPEEEDQQTSTPPDQTEPDYTLIIIIAAGVLLLFIIILVLVLFLVKRKKKKQLVEEEEQTEETIRTLQEEIDAHKRSLREAAEANSNPKETAITNEIREFAKDNPEITANLIRSWLKEDE